MLKYILFIIVFNGTNGVRTESIGFSNLSLCENAKSQVSTMGGGQGGLRSRVAYATCLKVSN